MLVIGLSDPLNLISLVRFLPVFQEEKGTFDRVISDDIILIERKKEKLFRREIKERRLCNFRDCGQRVQQFATTLLWKDTAKVHAVRSDILF